MTLRLHLQRALPLTVISGALAFVCTATIVRSFGAAEFAGYAIDLAKLSLLILVAELVPSSYSVFQQQKDQEFKDALVPYHWLAAVATLGLCYLMAASQVFLAFTPWIYPYVACVVAQRYFDCRLQAEGRLQLFYWANLFSNGARLLILLTCIQFGYLQPKEVIWGSLALSSLGGTIVMVVAQMSEKRQAQKTAWTQDLHALWRRRQEYYPYYLNVVLKRVRDAAMPLASDMVAPSRAEAGRYLLVIKGVEVVCGQLRVIEALLSNFVLRQKATTTRKRDLILTSVVAQLFAFLASILLAAQAQLDINTVILAFAASLFVYPYVLELAARSDAYANFQPRRVSVALAAYVLGIAIVVGGTIWTRVAASLLVVAPLLGQSLATATYWRRK